MAVFHRADLAVLVIFVQFYTSVVNNGLRAGHVYCRQIARFLCVCLSQRVRLFLGQIRQNAEAKTEIGPPSSDRALYSDKARSFNQSERALYRNFIINSCSDSNETTGQCSEIDPTSCRVFRAQTVLCNAWNQN